jgi:hypothetical protein
MRESRVSIVTTALPERLPYLHRLAAQAPWLRSYEWIICGPAERRDQHERKVFGELNLFAHEVGAVFLESDENMGTCRNLCAAAATNPIIVQVDDDDWQHPGRVAKQVDALTSNGAELNKSREVVGSSWLYCLHAKTATASRISYWDSLHCLPGATLAYWRSAWQRHPFEQVRSEDGPFTQFFGRQGTCFDMHDPKLLVYMRHEAHLPEQRDWWRETRSQERKISAAEKMRRRIENPSRPLQLQEADTPRDVALAHENEAATVYVKWLMGEKDFTEFTNSDSVKFGGEVIDDQPHDFDRATK